MSDFLKHNEEHRGFTIEAVVRAVAVKEDSKTATAQAGFAAELAPDGLPSAEAEEFLRRYPGGKFAMSLGTLEAPLGAKIEAWAPGHVIETAKVIIDALLRTLIG